MADLKISQLGALAAANVASTDVLAIVDASASETKKITLTDLLSNSSFTLVADASIPNAKIVWTNATLAGSVLANQGVGTTQIANDAITSVQLGDESTVDLVTTLPGSGGYVGQLAVDTDGAYKTYVWDGSAWQSLTAGTTTISGSTSGIVNIVATASGTTYTISATLDDTDAAKKFLAGPTGAGGTVGYRVIADTDLPTATSSALGAVKINGEGLRIDSGVVEIDSDVTAATNHHVVTHNAKGVITGSRAIASADLPLATSSAKGAIIPSTGLAVDGSGNVTIDNTVTGATKAKITYSAKGLVTAGADLVEADIPALPGSKITSGTIDIARIADDSVTAAKMANSSTCIVQSIAQAGFPTAAFTGQLCFDSVAEDAYLWDGNAWQAITTLTKGSLVNGGTYNASTSKMASVTTAGSAAGLVVGSNLPSPTATTDGVYVVVATAGTASAPAPVVSLNPPDYILGVTNASGSSWNEIDLSATVSGQTASNVSFTPYGQVASTNTQDALEELETEKMPKAGGTFTGAVEIGHGGSLSFEGTTNNAYETTLAVTDPTADRTITLPNQTGTVILSGNASIANADIATNAAIDYSKLAALADGKILVGNGSNVATAVTPSGDITISNAGVAAIGSGVIVDADINASAAIAGSKLAAGTTSAQGALQLSDATNSTSTSLAATANALKTAYDLGSAAIPKAGGTFTGDVNLGVDDTGVDLKMFGATASAYILWDASADELLTGGGATVNIVKDKLKIGGTAVTTTAAELNVLDGIPGTLTATELGYVDGVTSAIQTQFTGKAALAGATFTGNVNLGVDDTGVDLKLFGATAGAYLLWDESDDTLKTGGGAFVDIVKDKLKIGGTAVTTTAAELNLLDGKTAIGDAALGTAQTFTATQSGTITSVSYASSVALNLNTTNNFAIGQLTGAFTLANPSALTAGASGMIKIQQHASSPVTPAWGSYWHFPGGSASANITQTAGAIDILVYTVLSSTSIACDLIKDVKD